MNNMDNMDNTLNNAIGLFDNARQTVIYTIYGILTSLPRKKLNLADEHVFYITRICMPFNPYEANVRISRVYINSADKVCIAADKSHIFQEYEIADLTLDELYRLANAINKQLK